MLIRQLILMMVSFGMIGQPIVANGAVLKAGFNQSHHDQAVTATHQLRHDEAAHNHHGQALFAATNQDLPADSHNDCPGHDGKCCGLACCSPVCFMPGTLSSAKVLAVTRFNTVRPQGDLSLEGIVPGLLNRPPIAA